MKIALVGYGRMGHIIEEVAKSRGHEITAIIDVDNRADLQGEAFRSADVAIEFSVPSAAAANVRDILSMQMPLVCGTTGWLTPQMEQEVATLCSQGGTLLHATNFSIGVNVTMAASRLLTRLLSPYKEYRVAIGEVHHVHKLDHPSGTAITLAEDIIDLHPAYNRWAEGNPTEVDTLPIMVSRKEEVPGIHTVNWASEDDFITLQHNAVSRHGFAVGAVVAAEWLSRAPRGARYSMRDVLGI